MAQRIIIPTLVKCYIAFGVVFSVLQKAIRSIRNVFSRKGSAPKAA